jgi:hypothetical protein
MPYVISCDLIELCPQRLMSRVTPRTAILPSLAAVEGRRRLDLYCDGKVYTIQPDLVGVAQLRFLAIGIYSKSTQNIATGRGHCASRLNSCCLSVSTIAG